jgi:phage terminase small subunit
MGYITSIMSVPKRLTAQQEKFVMYLVYGHEGEPCSQTEAAKLAGYADPKDYASRLMNVNQYPLVVAHYESLLGELHSKYEQDLIGQKATLGQLRDAAKRKGRYSDAIRAHELIMKADGRFVDKRLNMNVKVDPDEAREKNERLMNIVKNKLAVKKIKD